VVERAPLAPVRFEAIVFVTMQTSPALPVDAYVIDVLMPDLIGHDRRPAAFAVYLYLLAAATRLGRNTVAASSTIGCAVC